MSLFSTPKDLCKQELTEFIGHKDEVNCVSYSSDFLFMVTGSDDERVRLFNVKTKKCVSKLKGHQGAIKCVEVSPCDKFYASGSYDKTARIWRTANGECLHVLKGHTKSVEAVTFSPGAIYLCSASWDRTAILWSVKTGCLVHKFEGHDHVVQAAAFSKDFKTLATGSWDTTIRVWTLNHPAYRKSVLNQISENNENQKTQNTFDDAYYGDDEKENEEDLEINAYLDADNDDGIPHNKMIVLEGHTGNVHAVSFSHMGMLASGSWDKTVRLWNPKNGWCLRLFLGHEGWVQAVSFSLDSSYVASAANDDCIKVWDIPSGKCINTLEGNTDMVQHCAFTADGMLIASGASTVEKLPIVARKKEDILNVLNSQ